MNSRNSGIVGKRGIAINVEPKTRAQWIHLFLQSPFNFAQDIGADETIRKAKSYESHHLRGKLDQYVLHLRRGPINRFTDNSIEQPQTFQVLGGINQFLQQEKNAGWFFLPIPFKPVLKITNELTIKL